MALMYQRLFMMQNYLYQWYLILKYSSTHHFNLFRYLNTWLILFPGTGTTLLLSPSIHCHALCFILKSVCSVVRVLRFTSCVWCLLSVTCVTWSDLDCSHPCSPAPLYNWSLSPFVYVDSLFAVCVSCLLPCPSVHAMPSRSRPSIFRSVLFFFFSLLLVL